MHIFEQILPLLLPCRTDVTCFPVARGEAGAALGHDAVEQTLLHSSLHTSMPGPGSTSLLPPSSLSFENQLVANDFSL